MGIVKIIIYIAVGIIVLIVKANKTKKLNEQKKLERLAKAKLAAEQQKEFNSANNITPKETAPEQQKITIEKEFIKDEMSKTVVDYDKIATDPNVDLIPDDIDKKNNEQTEKSFFERNFNEEFDLKKAVIYSEIINRKY